MKKLTTLFGFLLLATLVGIMLSGLNPVAAASLALATTATPVPATVAATTVITPTQTAVATEAPPATAVVMPTATLLKPPATPVGTATAKAAATVTPTTEKAPATKTPTKAPTATPTKPKAVAPRSGTVSALSTAFSVQNMDSVTTASVTGTFYDTAGAPVGSGVACSILSFFSCVVDQRATGGGLDGQTNWQGSVILSSNTQLAAVVNEYGGNMGTLGQDFRYDTYNGTASASASTTIMLPQGLRQVVDGGMGNKSFSSLIAIQNTSSFPANVTITYYQVPGTGTLVRNPAAIPSGAAAFINLDSETGLPVGWLGPIMITSDYAVAVTINQNAAGALSAYRGFLSTSANATLYFPQVLYAVDDANTASQWGTAISVLVADQTSSTVRVTYDDGTNPPFTDTKTAAPYALFDQRFDMPRLGKTRFYGTAKVEALTSGKTLFAIINAQTNYNATTGVNLLTATHFATADGKTTVFAPQVMRRYVDAGSGVTWSTSVNGRFLGGTAATINYTYCKSNGTTTTGSYVPAGTNFLIDQVFDSHMSDGQRGAMVLTSTQPFAITVNTTGQSPSGDASGVYIGVGQ